MLTRYVLADLLRNPRRTLSTMVGVTLGVGLFCGVLFFIDGLSASMTQRAVAPLSIDMQRIVTEQTGAQLTLTQTTGTPAALGPGEARRVDLKVVNSGAIAAHEVTVRSLPAAGLAFVPGSALLDGVPIPDTGENPFAHGPARTGFNLATLGPGAAHRLSYLTRATVAGPASGPTVESSYSTREAVSPVAANQPPPVALGELAHLIGQVPGVAAALPLSLADLGPDTIRGNGKLASGPARIFGLDPSYAKADPTIVLRQGALTPGGAVLSAEAARGLGIGIGGRVTVTLPDAGTLELPVSGIADLSRARALFSSRRGGDLETFIYTANSVIVPSAVFAERVQPAYDRAGAAGDGRLKTPPIGEIDITLARNLLDADPRTAKAQTEQLGRAVSAIAAHQDYLLDNISNTLDVATADAAAAKRLFVFLGLPGALLAAMLAGYAGSVLAAAQRREQATLRIRGAARRHLLRMLAVRTAALTAAGSLVGLVTGYGLTATILGRASLDRASTASLLTSAALGSIGGFVATGLALYITGRRSIDREINEDRARLSQRPPVWRRARLDLIGLALVVVATAVALRTQAFNGTPGSVYFGRSVQLRLGLLVLPVAVWITGSLLAARVVGRGLTRSRPASTASIGRPLPALYRLSVTRRPWAIGNGAIIVALIVGLATTLAGFTASYDAAKVNDARYANGADLRITPGPATRRPYTAADAEVFHTAGVGAISPVIFSPKNVILSSDRTSDPANVVAIDPVGYPNVAPVDDGAGALRAQLATLHQDPSAVLMSRDMAAFLKVKQGDTIHLLLVRSTKDQTEIEAHITGLFERLPGFPEGADAVMPIQTHTKAVPVKAPDFFLASATDHSDAGLARAVESLRAGPAGADQIQLDSRATTLARDQSSLAALNIAGLVQLDSSFSVGMAVVAIAIFVFGLLLSRRREYVTLRAQGLQPGTVRMLIGMEGVTAAVLGAIAGVLVGLAMGAYFVAVLRPLFVLRPAYVVPLTGVVTPVAIVLGATLVSCIAASRLVNRLQPTELLRDE